MMEDSDFRPENWTCRTNANRCRPATQNIQSSQWRVFTVWEMVLLSALLLCQALIAVATFIQLPNFATDSDENDVYLLFHSLVLINLFISILYLLYGLFFEKPFDVLLCGQTMTLIAVLLTLSFLHERKQSFALSLLQLICAYLALPVMGGLFYLLSNDMIQFKIIGTSYSIVRMYKVLCRTLALIKFELQLNVSIALYSIVSPYAGNEVYLLVFLTLLFVFVQYFAGKVSLSKEIVWLLGIYIGMSTITLLWSPIQYNLFDCSNVDNCTDGNKLISHTFLVFWTFQIIVRIMIGVQAMKCYKNFGFGLTDRAFVNLASNECTSLLGGPTRTRLMNI